jgi:hypothetical protein
MESVFPGAVLYFALDPSNKDIEGYNQLGIKSTVKVCVWGGGDGCVGESPHYTHTHYIYIDIHIYIYIYIYIYTYI